MVEALVSCYQLALLAFSLDEIEWSRAQWTISLYPLLIDLKYNLQSKHEVISTMRQMFFYVVRMFQFMVHTCQNMYKILKH